MHVIMLIINYNLFFFFSGELKKETEVALEHVKTLLVLDDHLYMQRPNNGNKFIVLKIRYARIKITIDSSFNVLTNNKNRDYNSLDKLGSYEQVLTNEPAPSVPVTFYQ